MAHEHEHNAAPTATAVIEVGGMQWATERNLVESVLRRRPEVVGIMRSDPLDVAIALRIGRGTLHKMRQNLGWAIGYNAIALPIAGVFQPAFGLVLRPEIAALSISGSSLIVAVNALLLKRLPLPAAETPTSVPLPATAAEKQPRVATA